MRQKCAVLTQKQRVPIANHGFKKAFKNNISNDYKSSMR